MRDVLCAGVGGRVASIHEGVDKDALKAVLARGAQQGIEMLLVGVDAAVGKQAEEMKLTSALLRAAHGLGDGRILLKSARGYEGFNAGDVHLHDAACADVEVADFAVAHLAIREADKVIRGLDQRVGVLAQQLVVSGLARQGDGVVGGFGAVTPPVEDGQNQGTLVDRHLGWHLGFDRKSLL